MSRAPRQDFPGAWHHVMNRGIARRTVFENRSDVRRFLAEIANRVHAGQLEVHAFCVLTTHFHLLVRSPRGELADAMQRAMNGYVRWYNRTRRRDGPLFRGRYAARLVTKETYRRVLVRYIDLNAVEAHLVAHPLEYPYGSARAHATGRRTPWLERGWIQSVMREATGHTICRPEDYEEAFGTAAQPGLAELVDRIACAPEDVDEALEELLDAAPHRVLDWMRRKARLADGLIPGIPVCTEPALVGVLAQARVRGAEWTLRESRKAVDGWLHAEIALRAHLCGATQEEIARIVSVSPSGVGVSLRRHRERIQLDSDYARRIAELATQALDRGHPGRLMRSTHEQ